MDNDITKGEKRVLDMIKDGYTDLKDIHEITGYSYIYTLQCLYNLRRMGYIKKKNRGIYTLIKRS